MADPARNAAIYAAQDGYSTANTSINGRRMAGTSFLKGYMAHADIDMALSVSNSPADRSFFAEMLALSGRAVAHHHLAEVGLGKLDTIRTLYYPAPNYQDFLWRRQFLGQDHHAICGVTHTTSTLSVMRGLFELRVAPIAPWDALICTSQAVKAACLRNFDLAEEYLRERFGAGAQMPDRPMMPVIPLGVNSADFAHDAQAGARLRKAKGWDANDVVLLTLARLLPYGKFDPAPYFRAAQSAQALLGDDVRLHVVMCGVYADDHSKSVFEQCAAALMPDVGYHHIDGARADLRQEALSGADIFVFPIDNVQETFGLAPIEAMAAGLPVIASDWDGIRDTVADGETGFLIPTRMASATHPEAQGYLSGWLNYAQYGNNIASMTEIDLPALTAAIARLASTPDLRAKMRAAGRARVAAQFDWSVVIPQYQDLWQEQETRRRAGPAMARLQPLSPDPSDLFASYPSRKGGRADLTAPLVAQGSASDLARLWRLRRMDGIGKSFQTQEITARVLGGVIAAGDIGITLPLLAKSLNWNIDSVERCALFLLKHGLVRHAPPPAKAKTRK